MSSKMNVLHLHLADSQSFPLQLASIPNITLYGAYSAEEAPPNTSISDLTHTRSTPLMIFGV